MSGFDAFLSKLGPKLSKDIKTASQIELIRRPLASRGLTLALGGGIGAGRITTVYGNQSSGKSLLLLESIAMWQKEGLVCGFADTEQTYDKDFTARLGVDNDKLLMAGSKSSDRLINEIVPWLEAGIDILVIDSISDIFPEAFVDKDGSIKDAENTKQIGAHAKAITALIKAVLFSNISTAVILLSQTTTKMESWGTIQVPHGGQKTLFGSSQIIRLSSSNTDAKQKKGLIKKGEIMVEEPIGRTVEAIVQKNKLGRQSQIARYDIYYGGPWVGIDRTAELVDLCVEYGIIEKGGAWYTVADQRVQGRDSVVDLIKGDAELEKQLDKELLEATNGDG